MTHLHVHTDGPRKHANCTSTRQRHGYRQWYQVDLKRDSYQWQKTFVHHHLPVWLNSNVRIVMVNHWHSLIWCHAAARLRSIVIVIYLVLSLIQDSVSFRIVNTGSRMPRIMSTFTTWWFGCFHHAWARLASVNEQHDHAIRCMIGAFTIGQSTSAISRLGVKDLKAGRSAFVTILQVLTTHRSTLSYHQTVAVTTTSTMALIEHQYWRYLFYQPPTLSIGTLHLVLFRCFAYLALNITLSLHWRFAHMDLIAHFPPNHYSPNQNQVTHFDFGLMTWQSFFFFQ